MAMAISIETVEQFVQRGRAGQFSDEDARAFMENPRLWRPVAMQPSLLTLETAQPFWQGVWDALGVKLTVPPIRKLTKKQAKSLEKFGFLLVFIPAITEAQYPANFIKPAWGKYLDVDAIKRLPLTGQWVAVETIRKPAWNDPKGYQDDRLMVAVKRDKRFGTSHDALTGGLLEQIAKVTGFPKQGTRLPSAEEWNLIGNLFNWLREHRKMNLSDLGLTSSWEWCQNPYGSGGRVLVGFFGLGGLADVNHDWPADSREGVAFRVLAVL